jgi:hypothetical protein
MGRPVPRQFMRNVVLDLTTIVPATAYHRRSYAERYSRYKQMIVLDTMDLEARDMVHRAVHEHHWRKEGKHHGSRGRGRQTFVAGNVPLVSAEIEAHLPLDHGIHQQPHDREHGQRCNPFRFLQPYRADGGGILDPTG